MRLGREVLLPPLQQKDQHVIRSPCAAEPTSGKSRVERTAAGLVCRSSLVGVMASYGRLQSARSLPNMWVLALLPWASTVVFVRLSPGELIAIRQTFIQS